MNKIIPKAGSWIFIRKIIPVEIPIDPLSVYFAVPSGKLFFENETHISDFSMETEWRRLAATYNKTRDSFIVDVMNVKKKNTEGMSETYVNSIQRALDDGDIDIEQQVMILTEHGQVCIQPHEYTILDSIDDHLEAVKEGEAELVFLNKNKSLRGKIKEQVFYIRSRGISFQEAMKMVGSSVKSQHVFYIRYSEEMQRYFTRDYDSYLKKKENFNIFKTDHAKEITKAAFENTAAHKFL
jgi:hypothetical protein